MKADYNAYVADMDSMPAPTNEEVEQMLNDMWREECERLEQQHEFEEEYKMVTGYWSGRSRA